jgi:hypothetical protein
VNGYKEFTNAKYELFIEACGTRLYPLKEIVAVADENAKKKHTGSGLSQLGGTMSFLSGARAQ